MPIALQKFLPLKVDLRLPVVDLAGARAVTGRHENELKAMVDTGDLLWAWNISRHPDRDRRELRFLVKELRALDSRSITVDDDESIRLLYGREKPFILGKHWHTAWNCDSGHMMNLVDDMVLGVVPGTDHGRGRGRTPCITWPSAVAFLKQRRLS